MRFAFWTGEEQGLNGSTAYAYRSYIGGEDIEGYLNLDMIAYNTIDSPRDIDLIYNPYLGDTHDLALLFADVVNAYQINLVPDVFSDPAQDSDHASFWNQGYTAILGIEDFSDFNPYYHGSGDTPTHTDLGYFTDFTKASIATFAHMGCLLPPTSSLTGIVSDENADPLSDAQVQAILGPHQQWNTTSDPDGAYELNLISGVYTVTAQAPGFMNFVTSGIIITDDTNTNLDITLLVTPTYLLTGTVRDTQSGEPLSAAVSVR